MRFVPQSQRRVVRDSLVVGAVTGTYGASFGAISAAAGLELWQTCLLSAVMFTGASQFAFVAELGGGGTHLSAVVSALLLGARNTFYGLRVAELVRPSGITTLAAGHLTLDESTAMSMQPDGAQGRAGFWVTGAAVFVFWNLATLAGALSSRIVSDPRDLGLDAAAPAAFVALLWPRLRGRDPWAASLVASTVALASLGLMARGVPLMLAAAAVVLFGLATSVRPRAVAP